ncbi:MAG TPA: helix-turn-helix domain-containing protein [Chryseolinea sp.]|nr:helix-turn-helix domain-containing protein [Chryseolinea sp.]
MKPNVNFFQSDLVPEPAKYSPSPPSTILVVNGNVAVREYLRKTLNCTYRIEEAGDEIDGLRLAKQILPDLIIVDFNVPAKGDPLCFQLKGCERTSHIPVVILTHQENQNNRVKSFYLGADDFMNLPLQEMELQVRVQNLIQSRKALFHKFSHPVELKPVAIDVLSENEIFLKRIIMVIEEHMSDTLFGSEQFAREMGLSQTRLYRKLTSLTGYASNDFIRRMRLQRAADLLQRQVGNVSDVAYRVGFNSLSYFAKCFREFYKCTPREYAKRFLN